MEILELSYKEDQVCVCHILQLHNVLSVSVDGDQVSASHFLLDSKTNRSICDVGVVLPVVT